MRGIYLPSKNKPMRLSTIISLSAAAECLLCFLQRKLSVVVYLEHMENMDWH